MPTMCVFRATNAPGYLYYCSMAPDPPTGLAKHSSFAGAGEAGTLYSGPTEITLTGISNIDINNPDSIGDPTTVLVEENLSPGS